MGFERKVYEKHKSHYKKHAEGGEYEGDAKRWLRDDTVDAWRHRRVHKCIDPILNADENSKWVTIGDGRFGREAMYINKNRGEAIPTDISTSLLEEAKRSNYIDKFREENAENLSFEDNAFDYSYCKETIHHLPRPYKGIYEMIRVAKKGAIICEPNDYHITDFHIRSKYLTSFLLPVFLFSLKLFAPNLASRIVEPVFEESGNFAYRISRREMQKVALGLNLNCIAIKGMNDHYIEGAESEHIGGGGKIERRIKSTIKMQDILTKMGIIDYRVLNIAFFNVKISKKMKKELEKNGWNVKDITENPNF